MGVLIIPVLWTIDVATVTLNVTQNVWTNPRTSVTPVLDYNSKLKLVNLRRCNKLPLNNQVTLQNVGGQYTIVTDIETEPILYQKEQSAKSQKVADINMSKITNKQCNGASDNNTIKMKELRQLEQKLKKKEE